MPQKIVDPYRELQTAQQDLIMAAESLYAAYRKLIILHMKRGSEHAAASVLTKLEKTRQVMRGQM
jgi:hypothetical protein